MSADDVRAITRIDRERYMEDLRGKLDTAWQAVLCLPEDHPRRDVALDAIQGMWETNIALAELIQDAERMLGAAHSAMTVATEQRDAIAGEMEALVGAIKNYWGSDHPLVEGLYDEIMEAHNAAFWESLPYDMAAVLGDNWSHMDADALYYALTADIDEVGEEWNGYSRDQLLAFRGALLHMIRALTNGGEA